MDFTDFFGLVWRDALKVWLDRIYQVVIELSDLRVVVLLFVGRMERGPRQVVNVPRVVQVDVGEAQGDNPAGFGKRRDMEVRAQRDGRGDGSL